MLQTSDRYTVNRDTLTIRGVTESDQGQYWCRGQRDERPKSSQDSNQINLSVNGQISVFNILSFLLAACPYLLSTVVLLFKCCRARVLMSFIHAGLTQERLKPVVKVTPDQRVFRGETVTLTCDIQRAGDNQWRYSWFKDGNTFYPYTTTTRAEFSFTADYVSYSGEYSCRGERSDISAAVTLTVSDLPRSTLTVTPDSPVFTGETVNLTCAIESGHSDWRYEWFKGSTYYSSKLQPSDRYTVNRDTLTIRGATVSDQDRFWCRGQIRSVSSYLSSAVYISVKDSPRSTLTVTPDNPVFTGETVNLTCVIESHSNWRRRNSLTYVWRSDWTPEWRYEWYKDTDSVMLQTSDRYTVNRDTLTIRGATESDQGQYWCRGQRDERPKSSQSSSVSLSVNDSPRSTLTVTPDSPVFTGETVSLTCVIESNHSDWRYEWTPEWRYEWYKDSAMLQTSDRYTVNRVTLTIRGATESDQGQYWCRGQRDERPSSSQSRSGVSLSVKDSPRSTLTVTPDSPVFTGETVNLTCVIESNHSDWRYEWFKDSVMLQTSDRYTVNRDTLTIRGATESDQGQYWCRGQRDERPKSSRSSSAVSLSVKDLPRSTLIVTPDRRDTGETLNLTCVIESNHSDWRYVWNKDSVMLQTSDGYTVNRDTLTIRGATESDQGQYWCRGQRDERPNSSQDSNRINLSVNGQISVFNILSFLLAACPYLLSTVVLLFKCCRARVTSTEDHRQFAVTEEQTSS
ncbi:hypothetical protein G5714_008647 [Onychostoma macrolepis]|uniref:Ig-like domain-containing protein n=1 Tax=Onychostoma macrolepis TaxID=369639 RepID=A0A7J6CWA2_9TELE|nr:hypothetical protein G5714_008647 [Onychostoma macrolepis]